MRCPILSLGESNSEALCAGVALWRGSQGEREEDCGAQRFEWKLGTRMLRATSPGSGFQRNMNPQSSDVPCLAS